MDIILGKNGNQPFPLTESSISRHHASFHLDEKSGRLKTVLSNDYMAKPL